MKLLTGVASLLLVFCAYTSGFGAEQPSEIVSASDDVTELRRYKLEMRNGKGHGFCEALLAEARRRSPNAEYRSLEPILTWNAIFGMPGVSEPQWMELDPLQHQDLFAKLYELYEGQDNQNVYALGNLNRLDTFFARERYPCQVCRLPRDERRRTTLAGYRDFATNGGRMRAFSTVFGETSASIPVALVQYEYRTPPAWSFSYAGWYGLSFYANPSLSDPFGHLKSLVDGGRQKRLVLYQGRPHILTLEDLSVMSVRYVPSPYWECEIVRRPAETTQP
jgi:hypothetical protein